VIGTAANEVLATIDVGDTPSGIAITPDGASANVSNQLSNTVSAIDTLTNEVVATIPVDSIPGVVAVTPDGLHVYVAHQFSDNVLVIDTTSNAVVATVPVGDTPIDIAVTGDGAFAYVTNLFSESVSVIDTATNTVAETVPVGVYPEGIAITPLATPADPLALLKQLAAAVVRISSGKSLTSNVVLALVYYVAQDVQSSCSAMTSFKNQVRVMRGREIEPDTADKLLVDAATIMTVVGCN
jgi:YVTN family beta-propeller protein